MRKAFLQLHTAIFLAGFTAILGKFITLSEAPLVWWRLLFAVVAFAILLRLRPQKDSLSKLQQRNLLGIGALVGLHWLFFFGSVKYGNISVALVCFSASGFFSALIDPLFFRKPIQWVELLLGLLCMLGISIIFHFDTQYQWSIVLGVLSAALSALFSIFNKKVVKQIPGVVMSYYEMAGAFIILSVVLPLYLVAGHARFWPIGLDWVWLLLLSLLCTVWAFVLQLQALRHITSVTLNLSYNLEPVYGILLAFLFFKENAHLNTSFFVGLALIITAVGVQMWRTIKQAGRQHSHGITG